MARLYQRGNLWYADIYTPNGRIRRSMKTTDFAAAQEQAEYLESILATAPHMVSSNPKNKTWKDAREKWLAERQDKKSLKADIYRCRALSCFDGVRLADLTGAVLMTHIDALKVSPSTKNRYIALVRAILRCAVYDWGWLDKTPILRLKREPSGRMRWLTREEAAVFLAAMPKEWAYLAGFALATGLRQSNVFGLKWSQVDMVRRVLWVAAEDSKTGRALGIPLNDGAMAILRAQQGRNSVYVFVQQNNRPFKYVNRRIWQNALAATGISDFRWHDLRHTWASWLVQSGVPLLAVQELGGWASYQMVRRYAHMNPAHLAPHTQHADVSDLLFSDTKDGGLLPPKT